MMKGNVLRARVTGGLVAAVLAVALAACAESDEVPGATNALTAPAVLVIDEGEPAADAESETECWTIRLTTDGSQTISDNVPCEQGGSDAARTIVVGEPAADAEGETECWTIRLTSDGSDIAPCEPGARDSQPDAALAIDESEPAADAGSENECWTTVLEADGSQNVVPCGG